MAFPALLFLCAVMAISLSVFPGPAPVFWRLVVTNYFTATALDAWGNESEFCPMISCTNAIADRFVSLGWDASPSPGVVNYRVYHGRVPGVWTNHADAGTNLSAIVRIRPDPLTNLVVRIACDGTDLIRCPDLGPMQIWQSIGATTWTETNPATMYWRSVGAGSSVTITNWME